MASKYAKRMTHPAGFPEVLKDFTREVLREAPQLEDYGAMQQWIYEFAARYFAEASASGGAGAGGAGVSSSMRRVDAHRGGAAAAAREGGDGLDADRIAALAREGLDAGGAGFLSPEDLEARIMAIFEEADRDKSGALDRGELKTLLRIFAEELGLSSADVRLLLSEADENDDGVVQYREFVPLAVEVIESIYALRRHGVEREARDASATEASAHLLLHGVPREQLEATLLEMFQRADTDRSGSLSRHEFAQALRSSPLGLTRKEINVLMAEVDLNSDGVITYEEFLPLCFGILVEMSKRQFELNLTPSDEAQLREYFLSLFANADADQRGALPRPVLFEALRQADLGLSVIQLHAILADAEENDEGLVDYTRFAASAAGVVAALIHVQQSAEKSARLQDLRASDAAFQLVAGLSRDEFRSRLADGFASLDPENRGRADASAVADFLAGSLGLGDNDVRLALSIGDDGTGDGSVDIFAIHDFAFDSLLQVQELGHISAGHL